MSSGAAYALLPGSSPSRQKLNPISQQCWDSKIIWLGKAGWGKQSKQFLVGVKETLEQLSLECNPVFKEQCLLSA